MPENDDHEPGWWIQFFDAIDAKKRHVEGLPWRLRLGLFFNFTSTVWWPCGMCYGRPAALALNRPPCFSEWR